MSIKPIDMQTNIGQMHEVARNTQIRSEAVAEQQNILDKESDEKSRQVGSRLEENKKLEHARIMREEQQRRRGRQQQDKEGEEKKEAKEKSAAVDETMGRFIDIKK